MTQWTLQYEPKVAPGPNGQAAFHGDRYRKRFRGLYGGTGGGKTWAAVAEDLAVSLLHPGAKGIVAAPDYPNIRLIVYPIFEAHLGVPETRWDQHPIVSRWNRSEHHLELRNGSTIEFLGLERPEDSEGSTVNWEHVTEARLVRNWSTAWSALKRRLRAKGYQGAWADTHSPTKELVDEFEGHDPRYGVYRWSTQDAYRAGVISTEYYEDMVGSHHGARAKAVLEGLYARPEGLVYDQFETGRHVRPRPDEPLGERPDATNPWTQSVSYGVDWGYTHAACITVWAWNGSKCHGLEEYWARFRTTPQLLDEAKRLVARWGQGTFWCGADEPQSVALFRAAGLDARILPPEKRHVKDGCAQVNAMLHADELHVDPSMIHWRDEVDQYALQPGSDEPEKDAPDSQDSARYAIVGALRGRPSPASTVRKPMQRMPRNQEAGELLGVR